MALTSAERMRARRKRLKDAGLCVICGGRKATPQRTVCRPCNEAAKARVSISRGHYCPACEPERLPETLRGRGFTHTCR